MVRIALGQINTTVGDLDGHVAKMTDWTARASAAGADLVCFPELAITGYPPEDLVLRPQFVKDNLAALEALAKATAGGCPVLVGFVDRTERGLHNAAGLLNGGEVVARYHKVKLPNYGVFDEQRYFVPGTADCPVRVGSSALGISVCEDAWGGGMPWTAYATQGVSVIPNINASPYHRRKVRERLDVCRARAEDTGAWIVYVNAVGGQDELVFDGGSMVVSPQGDLVWHAAMFEEDLLIVDIEAPDATADFGALAVAESSASKPALAATERPAWPEGAEEVYRALTLGLGDYVRKNGFREVLVGLSGGIDSALVATLAVDALGPGARRLPGHAVPYSSAESLLDAQECASRLGISARRSFADRRHLQGVPVGPGGRLRRARKQDVTEENIQARIRGNIADGTVEQVRLAGADDGQQERDGHRLLHALWRHGRRVRRDQGRAQDAGVRAGPMAERPARGPSPDPRPGAGETAFGASSESTRRTATRFRHTSCSTRYWSDYVEQDR